MTIKRVSWTRQSTALLMVVLMTSPAQAQFQEEFSTPTTSFREQGIPGWNAVTGDGQGIFTQQIKDGAATLRLDGRSDKRNIWYAFIQRDAAPSLPIARLNQPGNALRISARVKPSHGPRRVNLFLKSLTTGDECLREFDLPKAGAWYDLSMTTEAFRHEAGKPLIAQVSFMDWGNSGVYELTVDYMQVAVVDPKQAGPDQGQSMRYRPPLASSAAFALDRPAIADGTIDRQYPDVNMVRFGQQGQSTGPVLLVDGTHWTVLRWNLADLRGKQAKGAGQLEFYTDAVYRMAENPKDFGEVRVCELLGGKPDWSPTELTHTQLLGGQPESVVVNEQTIVDVAVTPGRGGKTTVTLSQPVMQRMIDGQTTGIVLKPLGLISAFLLGASQESGRWAARLRFNVE